MIRTFLNAIPGAFSKANIAIVGISSQCASIPYHVTWDVFNHHEWPRSTSGQWPWVTKPVVVYATTTLDSISSKPGHQSMHSRHFCFVLFNISLGTIYLLRPRQSLWWYFPVALYLGAVMNSKSNFLSIWHNSGIVVRIMEGWKVWMDRFTHSGLPLGGLIQPHAYRIDSWITRAAVCTANLYY